jgi:hypothetical protein
MEKAYNIIPTRLLKEGFLLLPGEGQEEGINKKNCFLFYPRPLASLSPALSATAPCVA